MATRAMSVADWEANQRKHGRSVEARPQFVAQAKHGRRPTFVGVTGNGVPSAVGNETTAIQGAKKRPKYGNEAEIVDGLRMMSRKEAKRYRELGLLLKGRQIDFLARQARFLLPGGIEFVADFVYGKRTKSEFTQEYTIVVEDAKGVRHRVYINKAKQMRSEHGIDVVEV